MGFKPVRVVHIGEWVDKNEYWIKTGTTNVPSRLSQSELRRVVMFGPIIFGDPAFDFPNGCWLFWQKLLDAICYIYLRKSHGFSQWTQRYSSYLWYSPLKPQLRI
jgi:hypothetical protein